MRVAPAKGASCIAMNRKIPSRRVIGFNLGSLITFRFCVCVCVHRERERERERELYIYIQDVHALQWRSFAASRRSGFMSVLDTARRNVKVRKPRLAFTAKMRPDPDAARF